MKLTGLGLVHGHHRGTTRHGAGKDGGSGILDGFERSLTGLGAALVVSMAALTGTAQAAPTAEHVATAKSLIADACGSYKTERFQVQNQAVAARFAAREDVALDLRKFSEFGRTFFAACKPTPQEVAALATAVEKGQPKMSLKAQAETVGESISVRNLKEFGAIPQADMEAYIAGTPQAKSCTGTFIGGAIVGGMLSGGGKGK